MPGNWKKKAFVPTIFQISTWKVLLLLLKNMFILKKLGPIPVAVETGVDQRLRVLLSLLLFLFFFSFVSSVSFIVDPCISQGHPTAISGKTSVRKTI